jgi:hypothetical protein
MDQPTGRQSDRDRRPNVAHPQPNVVRGRFSLPPNGREPEGWIPRVDRRSATACPTNPEAMHQPSLRCVRPEPRGCIRTHACWPDIVAVPATRCLEPPDYVSWRSSENRPAIGRSWIGAVARPRPGSMVIMTDGEMWVDRTRCSGRRGRPTEGPRYGRVLSTTRPSIVRVDNAPVGTAARGRWRGAGGMADRVRWLIRDFSP